MKDASDVTALVFDHSLFLPLARRLAKKFKRVLYHTQAETGFTKLNDCIVGDGFADIERCDDFWSIKNEIDLFVFPDIQHSGLQLELEQQGFPVWGSRRGDTLEINRQKFHRMLGEVGLDVPPYETVRGVTKLREYLQDKENVYLKISRFRGTLETTKFRNMRLDDGLLDFLAVRFGAAKDLIPFMVFEEIDTDLEIGGDTFCVDGQWPDLMLHGDEAKDKAYIGAVTKREDMPDYLKDVMAAFTPFFRENRYRNQWSMEVRVKDDKGFFIDPTCRGGMPSSNSQYHLWENLPEIIWHGAHGELVQPVPAAKFAAECILSLKKKDKTMWGKTDVPDEVKDWMHCASCCEIDGVLCFPPGDGDGNEIGWLSVTGDTLEELIETMKEHAKALPDGVSAETDALADLLAEIKSGEEQGIEFTEQKIPPPEAALTV